MPGDEQKKSRKPCMLSLVGHYRHYRLHRCISRTTTRRGINKIPKCFSCPGNCKELSIKTKRSTYDSHQARTKPWPTRPPTSDNNSPITKRIRTNETQNVSLTLATGRGLSKEARRWNCRNQVSSQLIVWQWLTHARRV